MSASSVRPSASWSSMSLHAEQHLVGDRRLLGAGRGQLAADHQLGELACGDVGRLDRGDGGAATHHGDLVGDGEHLVELVGDEDEGVPLGLELAQVREQRVDLLRHQHGRRLVEDDDLRAAVEDLEDLDALALADAERLDQLVGVEVEAVALGDREDLGAGRVADAVQLLGTQRDVLQHGQVVGQHEVLEDHADALVDRVGRRGEGDIGPVDADGAVVRLLHAVQDLHQRRLAGTVLTHEGVDGARADGDVDVVVGDHAREPLADAPELDGAGCCARWCW